MITPANHSSSGPRGQELLITLRDLQKDPLTVLLRSAEKYGDFVHLPLGIRHVYLVNQPELIQHILQHNHRNYTKDTFQYNLLSTVTGNGLLTSDGEFWLRQRRLIQPAFHRRQIAPFGETITQATATLLRRWDKYSQERRPVDVDAEMMQLALEIIGKTLFSVDLRAEARELTGAVLTVLDHIIHRARHPISLPLSFPTSRNREFRQALDKLDRAVYAIIQDRRQHKSPPTQEAGDLLALLLQAQDEDTGQGMDDRQLRDEVITLIIAGHETVASALTWTWYLLSQHAGVQNQLDQELQQVLGGKLPTSEDLSDLPITRMVFQESLRLYPPAWMISRKALQRDQLPDSRLEMSHEIRAGGLVVISPYVIHRHPHYWDNPERFDPWRFSPQRENDQPRFAYIPFGGGPRLCIGDSFALFEARLIIASIAQSYRLQLVPDHPVEVEALVTLRPRDGLWMSLERK